MKRIFIFALSFSLAACTSTATLRSANQPVSLRVNEKPAINIAEGTKQTYATTSFGQYKFKATQDGAPPLYGIVPLKFNGGYLATDILFFAPAMFFNLREAYPFYEFDLDKGEVKYRKKESDQWLVYKPTPAEVAHAKAYFKE